eukprot:m51a1_g3085 putative prolyl endopeptidase (710) ;mRNA; f:63493-66229
MAGRIEYPATRRAEGAVSGAGSVPDPYRWLEDPDDPETVAWCDQQAQLTESFLSRSPYRSTIAKHLEEVYNYPKAHGFRRRGEHVFFSRNDGLQNHDVLCLRHASGPDSVVLDPNTFSADGTSSASAISISETGNYVAYGRNESGSDWMTIEVVTKEGQPTGDRLAHAKFTSAAWLHDDSGFFYSRYPAPEASASSLRSANLGHAAYWHRLGDPQSADALVYCDREHPRYLAGTEVTDDGSAVLVYDYDGCRAANQVAWAPLPLDYSQQREGARFERLVEGWEGEYSYVTSRSPRVLVFLTSAGAPRKQLVEVDLGADAGAGAGRGSWRVLVPEDAGGAVLKYAVRAGQRALVLCYSRDACDYLEARELGTGRPLPWRCELPAICSVTGLSSHRGDRDIFIAYTSFTEAGTCLRVDVESGATEVVWRTQVSSIDPGSLKTEQVFYTSKDGTRVSMFVVSPASARPDGSARFAYLYGYGGFNIGITPSFNAFRLALCVHAGAVLAYPNIRGGDEYGERWHEAATRERKQNCFDDFFAAAEALVSLGWTRPQLLCATGGSNGGLLMGACLTQRPELFGCVVARVGVLDMLRFHKFTIGHAWVSEYGDPDVPGDFEFIARYSPLHNVRAGAAWPAVLLTTADHDDRVVPMHTFKFASEMQRVVGAQPQQTQPLLVRVERKAGHGAGVPLCKVIAESADIYAFMLLTLGVAWN